MMKGVVPLKWVYMILFVVVKLSFVYYMVHEAFHGDLVYAFHEFITSFVGILRNSNS